MRGIIVLVGLCHGDGGLQQAIGNGMLEQHHPVEAQFIRARLADELLEVLFISKNRVVEASVHKSITIPLETLVDHFKDTDTLFCGDILHVSLQHFLGNNAFHFGERHGGKILVCGNLQAICGSFNLRFVLALQGSQHGRSVGNAHEVQSRYQCFLNGLLVIKSRAAMLNDAAYLVECFLIRVVTLFASAGEELFLLSTFSIKHFQADKPFVHTDGILPIVGR